jgi:hypothetical protein
MRGPPYGPTLRPMDTMSGQHHNRAEGAGVIGLGAFLAVGGYLLGNVIEINGRTFGIFYLGILVGAVLIILGAVKMIRGD